MHYFSIHLPSATTVSFTVSTRPLYSPASSPKFPRSLLRTSTILTLFEHAIRVSLVFCVALANIAKVQTTWGYFESGVGVWSKLSLLSGPVRLVAEKTHWWILGLLSLAILFACARRDYVGMSSTLPFSA